MVGALMGNISVECAPASCANGGPMEQKPTEYVVGHSESELERLASQARFYERQTRLLFFDAQLGPGQRVLDFGCGVGDVAFLAAQLVGETGSVVGMDRAPVAVQTATRRAQVLGLRQVKFICGDENSGDPLL